MQFSYHRFHRQNRCGPIIAAGGGSSSKSIGDGSYLGRRPDDCEALWTTQERTQFEPFELSDWLIVD